MDASQAVTFDAEHWPHAPDAWQAFAPIGHSESAEHLRQAWVAMLHTGVVPEQLALLVHTTHAPDAVSQTGVAPPHWLVFVAEHWPHAPDAWHTGVAPPQSPSPAHA